MGIVNLIFENSDWWSISKTVARVLGLQETVMLMEHVSLSNINSNKEYHCNRNIMKWNTTFSDKKQKALEDTLIRHGFLTRESKGVPARNYYHVNTTVIEHFIGKVYNEQPADLIRTKCVTEENKGFPVDSDETEAAADKIRKKGETKRCIRDKDSSYEEGLENSSKDGTPKKSRLKSKEGNVPEPEEESLTDRIFKIKVNLSDRNRQCIEYWNKQEFATSHLINTDSPSKLLRDASVILDSFFNGNYLDMVIIPYKFEDAYWFAKPRNIVDFEGLVDEFMECAKNPDVRPVYNGTKFNIMDFLKGNTFTDPPRPSMMLNYCFGEYKSIIKNKNPKLTAKIKIIWEHQIGNYVDSPAIERAFVACSNLCLARFSEKKEQDDKWTPAMGDYRADGIIRNILHEKAKWFKEEKKTPEILGGSYVGKMIRRYDYNRETGKITY